MVQHSEIFLGDRLKEAREFNELSQSKLAQLIDVQRQTISAIEKGTQAPSHDTALKLVRVLEFPFEYFYKYSESYLKRIAPITFRGKANNTKRKKIKAELYDQWFVRVVDYLNQYIEFPEVNEIFNNQYDFPTLDEDDIEQIAERTREELGIGQGPISNLVNLVESLGVFLGVTDLPSQIDAFSSIYSNYYCVYMNYSNNKAVRSRFNLAHELGHLLLHKNIDEEFYDENFKFIESQANDFAGSFLLPQKSFKKEFYSLDMNSLLRLKERWKVSVQAIIIRAKKLDLITEDQFKNSFRRLSYAGFRKEEPLDDILEVESPQLISKSVDLIVENGIKATSNILDELGIPKIILARLLNKRVEYFDVANNIVEFNLRIRE